ncbi:Hydrolethalus syndrome protein 1 [Orchesella cincta]|uniref:Hydrolethalus syndrome protein 1 n=1 Tax=Orchesella cincta TaxID=48709 RepID=A0A1D2NGB4_ORCCI|nr:Hydrolethalus syndrome protein 1 [Orchesella cincta]
MPIIITKDEVKEFLEEQGFDVSDENTLRKFVLDLKKLIKFEDMKRRRHRLGHRPEETVLDSTDGRHHATASSRRRDTRNEDDFEDSEEESRTPHTSHQPRSPSVEMLYSNGRERDVIASGSKGNERSSTESYRSSSLEFVVSDEKAPAPLTTRPQNNAKGVAVNNKSAKRLIMKRVTAGKNPNGESVIEESDVDLGPAKRPIGNNFKKKPPLRPQTAPIRSTAPFRKGAADNRQGPRPTSARDKAAKTNAGKPTDVDYANGKQGKCDREPDELFNVLHELIFPSDNLDSQDTLFSDASKPKKLPMPPPHVARDPVALYHWYKRNNWDIYSIPGEDRHMQLRWNVRAKTAQEPCAFRQQPQYVKQRV